MSPELPPLALSVRQPYAWAIIHAGKDIENRTWNTRQRGRIAIHAAKGMTPDEYYDAGGFLLGIGVEPPDGVDLRLGGIIGSVEIVDVVTAEEANFLCSVSPWFEGPYGLVLRDPQPCEFIPARGALGFFRWQAEGA